MMKNLINRFYVENEDIHIYIHQLIANKNIKEVRRVLRHKRLRDLIDINYKEGIFLRTASINNDLKMIKLLLIDRKIGVNANFDNNYSNDFNNPFIVSVLKGNLKTILFFLNNEEINKKINLIEKDCLSLGLAVWGNHINIAKELFKRIERIEKEQFIKFFISAFQNIKEEKADKKMLVLIMKELEKRKIEILELEEEGRTILDMAMELNNIDVLEAFLPYFIKNKAYVEQSSLYALKLKRFNCVNYLSLEKNISIPYKIDMFSCQEIKDFLYKLELYKKYTNNKESKKTTIIKI